jgi:arginine/lysine/histidine/glutamine transport system substrate-binding/permease protein
MNAFGATQNLQIEFKQVPVFDDVIRELYGRQVDAAIAAITITPERQQIFSFSRPYFKSGAAIAIRESTTEITDLNSLKISELG